MHSEYRIEKERLPVVVVTTAGDRMFGDMFVQAYARHRSGREEPADIVNGPEPFFPLALSNGDTVLLAKDWVREVEIVGESRLDTSALASRAASVEVTVTGGPARVGRVYLEVPFDRPRLLDFLNHFKQRFLALHTDDGVRLVNVRLLERVRPLD